MANQQRAGSGGHVFLGVGGRGHPHRSDRKPVKAGWRWLDLHQLSERLLARRTNWLGKVRLRQPFLEDVRIAAALHGGNDSVSSVERSSNFDASHRGGGPPWCGLPRLGVVVRTGVRRVVWFVGGILPAP